MLDKCLNAFCSAASLYCVVQCEGASVRSEAVKNVSPQWNLEALFYQKDPNSSVKIQVWNHSLVMDQCLGRAVLPVTGSAERKEFDLPLVLKKAETPVGSILVESFSTDDVLSV